MEAKKPHHLLSASWRTRTASRLIQSEKQGASTSKGRWWCPRPSGSTVAIFVLLSSGQQQIGWCHTHWERPSASFSSPTQIVLLSRNSLTRTRRNNASPAVPAPCSPAKLHDTNRHTIEGSNMEAVCRPGQRATQRLPWKRGRTSHSGQNSLWAKGGTVPVRVHCNTTQRMK